jgi:hypothetical protein
MFPLSKNSLSILEIADYWSRQSDATRAELYKVLEGAWWRGDLVGDAPVSRLELLKNLFASKMVKLDFIFESERGPRTCQVRKLRNGDVRIDLRPRITVPSKGATEWTEVDCGPAFNDLSEASSLGSVIAPALAAISLTHDEFFNFVARSGYQIPTFWKPSENAVTLTRKKKSGPQSKVPVIEEAAERLFAKGRTPESCGGWKQFQKELLDLISVEPDARGYGEDTIQNAVRALLAKRG